MRQQRFGHFERRIGRVRGPVAQRSPKTVRALGHPSAFHQSRHRCVRDHSLPDRREQETLAREGACQVDHPERLGRQGHPEIRDALVTAVHFFARDRPDITFDLLKSEKADRARADAGQDQEPQSQVGDAGFRQRGIKGRQFAPVQRRDVLGLVARAAKQGLGLVDRLQVDRYSHRRRMLEHQAQAVQRFARGIGLGVPERGQKVLDVALVDLADRGPSEPRQDMDFQRRHPASRDPVALQLGLARIEGIVGDRGQRGVGLALSFLSGVALLDRDRLVGLLNIWGVVATPRADVATSCAVA